MQYLKKGDIVLVFGKMKVVDALTVKGISENFNSLMTAKQAALEAKIKNPHITVAFTDESHASLNNIVKL